MLADRPALVAHALNWRLAKTEIAKIIENGEPKIFICEGKFKDIKSELQKEIDFVDHWMEYGEGSDNSFEKLIDSSSCEDVEQAQTVGDEDPFFILYTGEQQESLKELYILINLHISVCLTKQLLRE